MAVVVVVVVVAIVVEVTPPGRKSGPPPLGPRLVHGTTREKKKVETFEEIKNGSQAIRKALQVKFESKTKEEIKRGNNRSGRDHMQIARPAAAVVEVGKFDYSQQRSRGPTGLIL